MDEIFLKEIGPKLASEFYNEQIPTPNFLIESNYFPKNKYFWPFLTKQPLLAFNTLNCFSYFEMQYWYTRSF